MNTPPVTLLFVPGHLEHMIEKAATIDCDAIVFDLEDSVPYDRKSDARSHVSLVLATWPNSSGRPYIRVNSPNDEQFQFDLSLLDSYPEVGIVIPKVNRVTDLLPIFDRPGNIRQDMFVSIETPLSLLHVAEFAQHELVTGLFLGGEDLATALGMRKSSANKELDHARFLVLAAARAYGRYAFDTICPEFRDLDILQQDATRAEAMGFDGKFAIHPAQVSVIRNAFRLSDAEARLLHEIVATYDNAVQEGRGAVEVNGQMIDPPVAERARAKMSRHNRD